jgi:hypothetical protein
MAKLRSAKNKESLFGAGCLGLIILAAVVMCTGNDGSNPTSSAPSTSAEQYATEWQDPTPEVMRVLAKNRVRGCGEFYQKASRQFTGEYAVACTRTPDGRAGWVGYLVWTGTEKVQGPDLTAVYTQFGGPPRQLTQGDI